MNKAFIDTNLFIRFITNDIPEQAAVLDNLFSQSCKKKIELISNSMVVAEIIWTLESFYDYKKSDIEEVVTALVYLDILHFDERDILLQALEDYRNSNVDFVDAYIAAWMNDHGVQDLYTFNKKHFKRLSHVNVLDISS